MKMKHNKKRNSAFIFEVLIRELTKSIIEKDNNKKKIIISLIKENFKNNTILSRDLELYKALLDTRGVNRDVAEKLMFECRMQRCTIDQKQLFLEQGKLINKINKYISKNAFSTFVPNYRNIATAYQIFDSRTKTKKRVLLENQLILQMIGNDKKENHLLESIDNLTLRTFIKNFNQKYNGDLIKEQRELLNVYISAFSDNGSELCVFLNEEITRLKKIIKQSLELKEIKRDAQMLEKTQKILEILNNTSKRPVDGNFVEDILKIQNLVKEINQ